MLQVKTNHSQFFAVYIRLEIDEKHAISCLQCNVQNAIMKEKHRRFLSMIAIACDHGAFALKDILKKHGKNGIKIKSGYSSNKN